MSQYSSDQKLAVIAYLREHANQNSQHLIHVNHVLNGEPLPEIVSAEIKKKEKDYIFGKSFIIRMICCFIIASFFYLITLTGEEKYMAYIGEIQQVILNDYSDKLFDFIEEIPYTFTYEKINVKG